MKSVCYKTPEQKSRQNIRFPEPAYEKKPARAHDVDKKAL